MPVDLFPPRAALPWQTQRAWAADTWPWRQIALHTLSSATWWQTEASASPPGFRPRRPSCRRWSETTGRPCWPAEPDSLWVCFHWAYTGSPAYVSEGQRGKLIRQIFSELVIWGRALHTSLSHNPPCYWQIQRKPLITHQEPDAELAEEPLVVLVVLLVVELDVVQRVVGGGEAHLATSVHLKLALFRVNFCLLQKAEWTGRGQHKRVTLMTLNTTENTLTWHGDLNPHFMPYCCPFIHVKTCSPATLAVMCSVKTL